MTTGSALSIVPPKAITQSADALALLVGLALVVLLDAQDRGEGVALEVGLVLRSLPGGHPTIERPGDPRAEPGEGREGDGHEQLRQDRVARSLLHQIGLVVGHKVIR